MLAAIYKTLTHSYGKICKQYLSSLKPKVNKHPHLNLCSRVSRFYFKTI